MLAVLVCARFAVVGADCYWAVALGRFIAANGVPDGVPFAAAPSSGWPNVPVAGELLLAALAAPGPWGLVAGQLVLDVVTLVLLGAGARRAGAGDGATALVLGLVVVGALAAFVVVRLQVFSLALFPLLLLLLRSDYRQPTRRVWWVVPLIAVWGNLHGAVLVGLAVTGIYLLLYRLRRRPAETVAVGLASLAATLANPALLGTVHYYGGVLGNEAARRRTGLWASLDLHAPFDVVLVAVGVVIVLLALWSRPPWWEVVAGLGLLVGTVLSARHGVWLLMFGVAPAALQLTRRRRREPSAEPRQGVRPVTLLSVALGSVVVGAVLVGGRLDDLNLSGRTELVDAVRSAAQGRPVLADSPLAESLAAAGVQVWMGNPLDAFPRPEQAAYLDVLAGQRGAGADAALEATSVVVFRTDGPAEPLVRADPRFRLHQRVLGWSVYVRVG